MSTKDNIAQFGNGDHWYYDMWNGFAGQWIDDWYYAELTGRTSASISGPHRSTPEEAVVDVSHFLAKEPDKYDTALVVKCSPALRITVEREVPIR